MTTRPESTQTGRLAAMSDTRRLAEQATVIHDLAAILPPDAAISVRSSTFDDVLDISCRDYATAEALAARLGLGPEEVDDLAAHIGVPGVTSADLGTYVHHTWTGTWRDQAVRVTHSARPIARRIRDAAAHVEDILARHLPPAGILRAVHGSDDGQITAVGAQRVTCLLIFAAVIGMPVLGVQHHYAAGIALVATLTVLVVALQVIRTRALTAAEPPVPALCAPCEHAPPVLTIPDGPDGQPYGVCGHCAPLDALALAIA